MPQMAPTLWLFMLITLVVIIITLKTFIYFWVKTLSLDKNNKKIVTLKKNWMW